MKTSYLQYVSMVEFMEKNGDLSKPSGGPRGRHFIQMKWKELTAKLNSDGTGDSRPEDKWRKVWSDLKNNTKRKWAKINKAAGGTGGGPALQLSLTDLENRVMQIIGVQAVTGLASVQEAGFQQSEDETTAVQIEEASSELPINNPLWEGVGDEDWNRPGTSGQETVIPPDSRQHTVPLPPSPPVVIPIPDETWKPAAPKKKKIDNVAKMFIESDKIAREYAKERDLAYERLENERLRLRDYEVRERVRQRDLELNLQAQWLEFLKEAMNVIVRYFERETSR